VADLPGIIWPLKNTVQVTGSKWSNSNSNFQ
jgi:hypothetical protein